MGMAFQTGFTKIFTTTLAATVGTTTGTTDRQTLPGGILLDSNTIYISPNGSDANPGTSASPVLTIANAITKMGGAKLTLHFKRNSYVGAMVFPISTVETLASTYRFQTELGEISTIMFTADASLYLAGTNEINGFTMVDSQTRTVSGEMVRTTGTGAKLRNCDLFPYSTAPGAGWNLVTETVEWDIRYCFVYSNPGPGITGGSAVQVPSNNACTFQNNIFVRGGVAISGTALEMGFGGSVLAVTVELEQNLFLGWDVCLTMEEHAANYNTYNLKGCGFEQCNTVATAGWATVSEVNVALSYCHNRTARDTVVASSNTTINLTETFAADPSITPLYVDVKSSRNNGTVAGTRLRQQGKATGNGGRFFLTSILFGHYTPDGSYPDVTPWEESTVLTSQDFTDTIVLEWPAANYSQSRKVINPITIADVRGNQHTAFDAVRRSFQFTFGGGSIYASNNDLRKMVRILADNGAVRFYPQGISANMFQDPTTGNPDAIQAVFDSTDSSASPVITSGFPMIPRNWAGWIVEVDGNPYYVESSDTAKLILVDLFGVGFPSDGVQPFVANSFLVSVVKTDLVANQEIFTKFQDGGGFRETDPTFNYAATLAHELSGYSIELAEISGLVEDI